MILIPLSSFFRSSTLTKVDTEDSYRKINTNFVENIIKVYSVLYKEGVRMKLS